MDNRVKVWPLRPGVQGENALGNPCELAVGVPGWMSRDAAEEAIEAGSVKAMAGADIQALNRALKSGATAGEEATDPGKGRRRGRPPKGEYMRSDMTAEE